jgi:hypothetical protein
MAVVLRKWSIDVLKTPVPVQVHTLCKEEVELAKLYPLADDANALQFVEDCKAAIAASVKAGEVAKDLTTPILFWRQLNTQGRNLADTSHRERLADPKAWQTKQDLKTLERVMNDPDTPAEDQATIKAMLAKYNIA